MATMPGPAPVLPGFHYVRPLGVGGFADVFLYEQDMPRRKVAVKVFHGETVNPELVSMFAREADAMAALSAHPSILTIHQASVSADGRPYLVLEYCQNSIGKRYRTEYLPVPEVLQIGVRIGSALETCHRSGILHRDIKPSNLLVNQFGSPVLSDFGIVGARSSVEGAPVALSVPWSAPEVVSGTTSGTISSEVWSLGATLYALLAGHGPFEVPGQAQNTNEAISRRISKAKYTRIDRQDVPDVLQNVLAKSMAANSADRYRSLEEMANDLRAVEYHLGLPPTDLQLAQIGAEIHSAARPDGNLEGIPVRSHVDVSTSRRRGTGTGTGYRATGSRSARPAQRDTSISRAKLFGIVMSAVAATSVAVVSIMLWLGG